MNKLTQVNILLRNDHPSSDAWHYVEVKRHRVPLFLKKTKSGNVDVAAFGVVVKVLQHRKLVVEDITA